MRRLTNLPFSAVLAYFLLTALISCNRTDWEETSSGLKIRILRDSGGKEFISGQYLYLTMDLFDEKDSMLFTWQTKGMPVTLQYRDSAWVQKGQIYEGLQKLKVGDSAVFKVNCENLYLVSLKDPLPEGVDPESEITVRLGVENMSTPEEFRIWQNALFIRKKEESRARMEQQLYEDIEEIDEYLKIKDIIPMEHESGMRYIIHREGEGEKPVAGDEVRIHYNGELLDGTQVNSSHDHKAPVVFTLGNREVIQGLEIGVSLMTAGATYTFYIPSGLALAERQVNELIIPNSNLVYTVELLEIQKKEE